MGKVVGVMLVVVGVIHLLPLSGVLGAERLAVLYGTTLQDPSLVILMRHRAVLFGLLGILLVCAAFRRSLQLPALVAGFASVGSFLVLAYTAEAYNAELGRVVLADWVALACLVVAAAAAMMGSRSRAGAMPGQVSAP